MDQALNTSEVARRLKKDRKTIRKWVREGKLAVWFLDDNGRPVFSEATIAAHQRRAGELHAERAS